MISESMFYPYYLRYAYYVPMMLGTLHKLSHLMLNTQPILQNIWPGKKLMPIYFGTQQNLFSLKLRFKKILNFTLQALLWQLLSLKEEVT